MREEELLQDKSKSEKQNSVEKQRTGKKREKLNPSKQQRLEAGREMPNPSKQQRFEAGREMPNPSKQQQFDQEEKRQKLEEQQLDDVGQEKIHKYTFSKLLKMTRKSDDTSDPIDVLILDKIAIVLSLFFIRIKVSANMISVLSLMFSVIGSLFIYPDDLRLNIFGIAMVLLAMVLDNSDGQVARFTGTASQTGRILDGFCDSLGFCSLLISLSMRLMHEPIPFLNGRTWGGWIWLLMVVYYSFFYPDQCRMADYYRNVHLFFLNQNRSELTHSGEILENIKKFNRKTPIHERIFMNAYYLWTRSQEFQTPKLQKLLTRLRKCGDVPPSISAQYVQMSRKYIICTNLLTCYLRTFTMFVLIILHIPEFFFPFAIVVLGGIEWFMISRYEAIAEKL